MDVIDHKEKYQRVPKRQEATYSDKTPGRSHCSITVLEGPYKQEGTNFLHGLTVMGQEGMVLK